MINNVSNTPPRRKPTVSATPIAPIKLNKGVPIAKVNSNAAIAGSGIANSNPSKGANNNIGKPLTSQCANTFASTSNDKGCGLSNICSNAPSSKSERNRFSSENKAANKAAIQITPGAIFRSKVTSGLTPNGNKVTIMKKNSKGFANSPRWRKASSKSRFIRALKAWNIGRFQHQIPNKNKFI